MDRLRGAIEHHLRILVTATGPRPPGSPANQRVSVHALRVLAEAGFRVRADPFTTRWWEPGPGSLEHGGTRTVVQPNPFGPACDVTGDVVRAGSLAELERFGELHGHVLVLTGDVVAEPVAPSGYPFYEPEDHRRLVAAITAAAPAAVVAVSDSWQPVFEDAALSFPSVTVPPTVGETLVAGRPARVALGGRVHRGEGINVSARFGPSRPRLVLSAHLDAKVTTPGAFDNAGSVAVVLAAAEAGLQTVGPLEIVLFNGEDHFDACGEVAWLAASDLAEVAANVNLDGTGLAGHPTTIATLAVPPTLDRALERFLACRPDWERADPWVESDHAIFAARGIPAVAVTSGDVHAVLPTVAHGPHDTLDVLDPDRLTALARDLPDLVRTVAHHARGRTTGQRAPRAAARA